MGNRLHINIWETPELKPQLEPKVVASIDPIAMTEIIDRSKVVYSAISSMSAGSGSHVCVLCGKSASADSHLCGDCNSFINFIKASYTTNINRIAELERKVNKLDSSSF